jgi:glycerol-1-phosphate dehydrogenase [NAD(P)+]
MRALVVVGIAMAYMGNSRPASGSEHHLSHYFEVVGLLRSEPYFCHGIDVAYSTYETARLRGELIALAEPPERSFDISDFEENIKRVYTGRDTKTAEGIIALQKKLGWIFEDRTPVYRKKWDNIRQILAESPSPDEISALLLSVGLSITEFYETYSKEKIADAVRYAKYLKDRYTVLWI